MKAPVLVGGGILLSGLSRGSAYVPVGIDSVTVKGHHRDPAVNYKNIVIGVGKMQKSPQTSGKIGIVKESEEDHFVRFGTGFNKLPGFGGKVGKIISHLPFDLLLPFGRKFGQTYYGFDIGNGFGNKNADTVGILVLDGKKLPEMELYTVRLGYEKSIANSLKELRLNLSDAVSLFSDTEISAFFISSEEIYIIAVHGRSSGSDLVFPALSGAGIE